MRLTLFACYARLTTILLLFHDCPTNSEPLVDLLQFSAAKLHEGWKVWTPGEVEMFDHRWQHGNWVRYCEQLAEEGSPVGGSSHSIRRLTRWRNSREVSGKAVFIQADVSDPSQAVKMVRQAIQLLGGLDLFVNNAAIATPARD
jgi:hypothetical protein